jgi:hypothetical protein
MLSFNFVKFEINLLIANETNFNFLLSQALNEKINQVLDLKFFIRFKLFDWLFGRYENKITVI